MKAPDWLHLLRPRQWLKNGIIVLPLFFTPSAVGIDNILKVLAGVAVFCLLSSGIYILNDSLDIDADRKHPAKKNRPLAAGRISMPHACAFMAALLFSGLLAASILGQKFFLVALAYILLMVAYCIRLKKISIIDALVVSSGFVLRLHAGAILIGHPPSSWMSIITALLALFLVFGKRRDDFIRSLTSSERPSLTGYNKPFLDAVVTMLTALIFITYLLYSTAPETIARLGSENTYITSPFVFLGLLRYLQIILVEEKSTSPTEILIEDRFIRYTTLGWGISFTLILYGSRILDILS